jgi:putative nucleotidyltransferase with HDIG domain
MAEERNNRAGRRKWKPPLALTQLAGALVFFAFTLGLLYVHMILFPVRLVPGQVVAFDSKSPMDTTYVDSAELSALRKGGKASILDPSVAERALLNMSNFFAGLHRARLAGGDANQQVEKLSGDYGVPSQFVAELITFSEDELDDVQNYAREVLTSFMQTTLAKDEISQLQNSSMESMSLTMPEKVAVFFLEQNIVEAPDIPEVEKHIKKLVTHSIAKGEIILAAGGMVDSVVLDKLEAVESGLYKQRHYNFAGMAVLLLLLMLVWYAHLRYYKQQIFRNPALWGQLTAIFFVSLLLSLAVGRMPFRYVYYCVPLAIAAAVIVLVTMYDAILALYFGIGLALIASLALNFNSNLAAYLLVSSTYPVVFLHRRSTPRHLAVFGFNLGLANLALVLVVILVSVETFSWWAIGYAFFTGVAAAVLALGITPILEMLSAQLTPSKLQALLNPENPMLKRLLEEAPGTYFHSMVMASMAEEACNEIGANGLLAKVGCMYHDIGKLKRPGFFAENISDLSKNPHQHLPPESSFNIIAQHITDGLELGRKAGLPSEVLAFIPEHHGTTIVKYFYEEARKRAEADGASVDEDDFRYHGPNPHGRETAVVMLADTCEAKVRAMESFTEQEVSETVMEVVDSKVKGGYLNESGLTVGDINRIAGAFTRVLVNLHHARLKYPEQNDTGVASVSD